MKNTYHCSARRFSFVVLIFLLAANLALVLPSPLGPAPALAQGAPRYADASNGLPDYSLWVSKTRFFDLDEDGVGDVMVLGPRKGAGDRSLHVFKWNGDSWSNESSTEGTSAISHSSYGGYDLGDLNNDGDWDVGVGSHGADRVDAYLRGPGATWIRSSSGLQASEDAWDVDMGDFNADGNLDLLVAGFWERDLHVYAGDGNGNWVDSSNGLGRASSKSEARFCDINNDGLLDIVSSLGHDLDTDEVIWVYRGDGTGNWYNSSNGLPESGNGDAVACGDFDNDGNVDIALSFWDGTVGAYLGDGEGNWSESSAGLVDLNFASLELVDLNNDKLDDLVGVEPSDPGRVHIFLRESGGFWTRLNHDLQGNAKGYRLDVQDFDHNGHPDIVAGFGSDNSMDFPGSVKVWREASTPTELEVTLTSPDGKEYLEPGGIRFIRWLSAVPTGTGSRTIRLELSLSGANGPWTTIADDLPDTGIYQWSVPDEPTGNGYVRITLEETLGDSAYDTSDRPFGLGLPAGAQLPGEADNLPSTEPTWLSDLNDTTYAVAWGDVDRDGDDDLVVGNIGEPNLLYYSIDGELEANASWLSDEEDPTQSFAWGDIDDDGWIDLIVGNGAWGAGYDRLYHNHNGTLSTSADWSASNNDHTSSVDLGDYDNDGDLDLATGVYDGYNCIYRNDDGQLTESPVWYSQNNHGTHAVVWVDVDNDGDLDLAAGNGGTMDSTDWNRNNIYENEGPAWNYRLSNTPTWYSSDELWTTDLEAVDIDDDGDTDLLAANGYGSDHRVVLYLNAYVESGGDDHLNPDYSWSVAGGSPYEIDVGDLDGDDDPDLAVCHYQEVDRVFLNMEGILATQSSWNSSDIRNSQSISLGDMEGDGRLEIAVGNQETSGRDGYETVYTSNTPPILVALDPANNSLLAGEITFRGTAYDPEDDPITVVQLALDDGPWLETQLNTPEEGLWEWSYVWSTTEADNGPHKAALRTRAAKLWSPVVILEFWVNNVNYAPLVTLDEPESGPVLWGAVAVSGTFIDFNGDDVSVYIQIDDGLWQTADTETGAGSGTGTWSYQWDVTRESEGPHELTVRGFDGRDHSPEVNITVLVERPNRAPKLEMIQPVAGVQIDNGLEIHWSATDPEDDALAVSLSYRTEEGLESITLASGLGASGKWFWDTSTLPNGLYTLVGHVTDGKLASWRNVTVEIFHVNTAALSLDPDDKLLSPAKPKAGDRISLTLFITNKGSMEGITTLTFTTYSGPFVDIESVVVTVPAGKSMSANVKWTAKAGELVLQVTASVAGPQDDDEDNTILITIPVTSAPSSSGNGNDDITWLWVAVIVLMTIPGALLFGRNWLGSDKGTESGGAGMTHAAVPQPPITPMFPASPAPPPTTTVPGASGTPATNILGQPADVPADTAEASVDDVDWSDED